MNEADEKPVKAVEPTIPFAAGVPKSSAMADDSAVISRLSWLAPPPIEHGGVGQVGRIEVIGLAGRARDRLDARERPF
jgi:hypothetical protein